MKGFFSSFLVEEVKQLSAFFLCLGLGFPRKLVKCDCTTMSLTRIVRKVYP